MDVRRTATTLALPAFPAILLVGSLVSPTDSTENATQLHAAAAHGPAWVAATLLELLAAAVLPLAILGVVGAVRSGRGRTLATVGGALGVLGTLGMAAIAFRHVFVYGMATIGEADALHALDRVDTVFGPFVLPLMFAGPFALIAIAAAAARAGLVSRWLPVAAFVFFVVDMLPIPAAEEIQGVVGIATFALLARATAPMTERRVAPAAATAAT